MVLQRSNSVIVVGAGCFGLSTAYHLLRRGFTNITVLDRSEILPAPDAASTDLNKIIRSAYPDTFYARFAREAIELWKDEGEWGDMYHECGVLNILSGGDAYANKAYESELALGNPVKLLENEEALKAIFPPDVRLGSLEGRAGYINSAGGWAAASKGVARMMGKAKALGANIIPGKRVSGFSQQDGKTTGVQCSDGTSYTADLVVLCAGSWTASSFPTLDLGQKCLATAQCLATIQLTPEETERYNKVPVYLDFNEGFYVFPPTVDGIVKVAVETAGYTAMVPAPDTGIAISTPTFIRSEDGQGSRIPKKELEVIRAKLESVYPELAKKPFRSTRMCWYTDSPDDDWIIGYHPSDTSMAFATAGSGHAYKFLPNIGTLVADILQRTADESIIKKFAVHREENPGVVFRRGRFAVELDHNTLCSPEDLLPRPPATVVA